MTVPWNQFELIVAMPHMAPGEKLSEVEFLKVLAAYQWEAISRLLGRRPPEIMNELNERLYGSLIDVELSFGESQSLDSLGEDSHISVRNRVNVYAKRFVEGLFVFNDQEVSGEVLKTVETRQDLRSLSLPWAYMTNAFISRVADSPKLKVFKPVGMDSLMGPELESTPAGIVDQARVQSSGTIEPFADSSPGIPLPTRKDELISYQIVPESDVNGAGLVYFARYVAMMNYGERVYLSTHLPRPLSYQATTCLSTDRRHIYYFANASPADSVDIVVSANLILPGDFQTVKISPRYGTPMKFLFRIDLYRGADKVLMASSLVRKSLNIPADAKTILMEAERFLGDFK